MYSSSAAVTASFLVTWPPMRRASSISLSSMARLVAMVALSLCSLPHMSMCNSGSSSQRKTQLGWCPVQARCWLSRARTLSDNCLLATDNCLTQLCRQNAVIINVINSPFFPPRRAPSQRQILPQDADVLVAAAGNVHDHHVRTTHLGSALDALGDGVGRLESTDNSF